MLVVKLEETITKQEVIVMLFNDENKSTRELYLTASLAAETLLSKYKLPTN